MKTLMLLLCFLVCCSCVRAEPDPVWQHLSSKHGALPVPPGGSTQQTGAVVGDFDGDGATDFILSFRDCAPALAWYRRVASGWEAFVIEKDHLTIEAGGAVQDIDEDGDLDVVFGGDWQSSDLWWWENPSPRFDKQQAWQRRLIKTGGKNQHHDQCFGDFLGAGKPQLAFWNQQARTLFLAEVPADVRGAPAWPLTEVVTGTSAGSTPYPEGMSVCYVDLDGKVDLLASNAWYQHTGGKGFRPVQLAEAGGLIFAGYFRDTKHPQIVISPGDGKGRLMLYECKGSPGNPADWQGRDLIGRELIHGHSLQLGDVDRDGHLDLFCGEMAKWSEAQPKPDHPGATGWLLYGDGRGQFRTTIVAVGHGWHETRLADLDVDGDLDLLNKPYNWEAPRVDVWLHGGTRAASRGVGTSLSFRGPVGLQLYSLRDLLGRNTPLGLQTARGLGFREVELAGTYGQEPARFRAALAQAGLVPVSSIVDYDFLLNSLDRAIADAQALGVRYLGTAGIPRQGDLTEAVARKAAADFNRFGEALAKHGIRFFYHNHGFEFVPHNDGTLFDLLVQETRPEFVTFEMDIFWTVHGGQEPARLLRKYPTRWSLLHVKDLRKGIATGQRSGVEDVRNDVVLGTGQVDVAAALRAAQEIGVQHYFIEDEAPTVLGQVPQSVRYLESLAW